MNSDEYHLLMNDIEYFHQEIHSDFQEINTYLKEEIEKRLKDKKARKGAFSMLKSFVKHLREKGEIKRKQEEAKKVNEPSGGQSSKRVNDEKRSNEPRLKLRRQRFNKRGNTTNY